MGQFPGIPRDAAFAASAMWVTLGWPAPQRDLTGGEGRLDCIALTESGEESQAVPRRSRRRGNAPSPGGPACHRCPLV